MLHHVSDDERHKSLKPYSISNDSFIRLLDYLVVNNFETLVFKDLLDRKSDNFFQKQVILTFDDCPKHLWEFAIPELLRRKMRAVFYMPTAHLGGTNSWDLKEGRHQVDLMDEADLQNLNCLGMEIGSHAHEHVRLSDLHSEEKVLESIAKSKQIIESMISNKVISLAYPFGAVPKNYPSILRKAGFEFATAIYHSIGDKYALRRMIYHDGDTFQSLGKKLSIFYKIYRFCSDPFKKAS